MAVQVYKVGKKDGDHGARTEYDPTDKPITPMGGFVGYGEVAEDYLIIKVLPQCQHFLCLKRSNEVLVTAGGWLWRVARGDAAVHESIVHRCYFSPA